MVNGLGDDWFKREMIDRGDRRCCMHAERTNTPLLITRIGRRKFPRSDVQHPPECREHALVHHLAQASGAG